jgi:hypothetical protein
MTRFALGASLGGVRYSVVKYVNDKVLVGH